MRLSSADGASWCGTARSGAAACPRQRQDGRAARVERQLRGGPALPRHLGDLLGLPLVGEREDRRARTGDDGGYSVRAELVHQGEALPHRGSTVLLVDAVLGGG